MIHVYTSRFKVSIKNFITTKLEVMRDRIDYFMRLLYAASELKYN